MTDEEREFYCGHVTMAARRLGISMKKEKTESGLFVCTFADPMAKTVIKGAAADSERDAVMRSCETLVNYLSAK